MRWFPACLVGVALIGGCSSGTSDEDTDIADTEVADTEVADTDIADTDVVEDPDRGALDARASARAEEVLAMEQADVDAALGAAGLDLELAVAKESGLEAELGGPDQARAALVSAWAPIVSQAAATGDNAAVFGFRAAPGVPSLGEGLFGGYLVASLGIDAAISAARDSSRPSVTETKGELTMSGSLNHGELSFDTTHVDSSTGVTTTLHTETSVTPCPDADGRFEIEVLIDVTVSKGAAGQRGTLRVKVVGQVDDDARLASSEMDYTMKWSRTSGGATELVDLSASGSGAPSTVTRTGGAATSDLEASATTAAQLYATMIAHFLTEGAERGWQSGRCVRLDVQTEPGPNDVRPGGTANITAAPRSTVDGGPVGGNVTATIEGVLAVEPNGSPLPADASFVYTAPTDDLPQSGFVSLESRSRRGVGKARVVFQVDAVAYVASGGGGEITFSGRATSPELAFTVDGVFPGGTATFEFLPDRTDDGDLLPTGVVTITGGGSGATITGGGTYTMALNPDGTLTVTMKTRACVDVSGVCRDSNEVITLTPES